MRGDNPSFLGTLLAGQKDRHELEELYAARTMEVARLQRVNETLRLELRALRSARLIAARVKKEVVSSR